MLPKEIRLQMYDYWKVNSEVSVHRSNDRNIIKISKQHISQQTADLDDSNISIAKCKKGNKMQAHRQITTKTYRTLHKNYQQIYGSNISLGSFVNLKPFFVFPPTVKEMELCLCSKCLNPHCLYRAIKSAVKDIELPNSLSQYLCK